MVQDPMRYGKDITFPKSKTLPSLLKHHQVLLPCLKPKYTILVKDQLVKKRNEEKHLPTTHMKLRE